MTPATTGLKAGCFCMTQPAMQEADSHTWRPLLDAHSTNARSELAPDGEQVEGQHIGAGGSRPKLLVPEHEARGLGVSQHQLLVQTSIHLAWTGAAMRCVLLCMCQRAGTAVWTSQSAACKAACRLTFACPQRTPGNISSTCDSRIAQSTAQHFVWVGRGAHRSLEHGIVGLEAAWALFPEVPLLALSSAAGGEVASHSVPGLCQEQPAVSWQ